MLLCQSIMLYHSTGATVFSVAMLFKETFSHPMDVAVFGVAMVLNETLLHPKDVTACSKRHYVCFCFCFFGCCCCLLLSLIHI